MFMRPYKGVIFNVNAADTIGDVITKLAKSHNLHEDGIEILSNKGNKLYPHESLKTLGLIYTKLEVVENYAIAFGAIFYTFSVLPFTVAYQAIVFLINTLRGTQKRWFKDMIMHVPHTNLKLTTVKSNITIPRYFWNVQNTFDLLILSLAVYLVFIDSYHKPEVDELNNSITHALKDVKNLGDIDISTFYRLVQFKTRNSPYFASIVAFLCVFRTIFHMEVYSFIAKTRFLYTYMIQHIIAFIFYFLILVLGQTFIFFVALGQGQNGNYGFLGVFFGQFDQSTSGINSDISHLSGNGDENVIWLLLQIVTLIFTVITIIVLFNLIIAVVTTAYEDGLEELPNWWAYQQFKMINHHYCKNFDNSPFYHLRNMLKKCNLDRMHHKYKEGTTGSMAVDDVIKDQKRIALETMWRNNKKNEPERSGSLAHLFQLDKQRELSKQNRSTDTERQENDVVDQFVAEEELKSITLDTESPSKKYIIRMNSENDLKDLASVNSENDNSVEESVVKSIWDQNKIDTSYECNTKDIDTVSIWGNDTTGSNVNNNQ
jgi:hypothetical protein